MYYIIFFWETCVGTYLSVFRFILLFTMNTSFSNTHIHTHTHTHTHTHKQSNNQTIKQINKHTIYTKEFTRVHQILIRFAFLTETLKSRFAFLRLVL